MTLPPIQCGGCRKCCLGDTITLTPSDNPSQYKTRCRDGKLELANKDGQCVYLGASGCTIYGRQPEMCRRFDCRLYALAVRTMEPEMQEARMHLPAVQEGFKRLADLAADT